VRKIITSILAIFMGLSVLSSFPVSPALAAKKGDPCTCADGSTGTVTVDTAILSGCDCSGNGGQDSITNILGLVVSIMSIGIGILGVIGITIVGIQYLTAGGNEEKTRKAKRRMFEIILGLVAYAIIYATLSWLIPGFSPFGS